MEHPISPAIEKLADLIQGIEVAILTTVAEDGSLRSRPMAVQKQRFDGSLWFFTRQNSLKTHEVQEDQRVNVSFADPESQRYVSVSGEAELVRDHARFERLWNPMYRAWFPDGPGDPNLALLRVDVQHAEYWDSSSQAMVHFFGAVKTRSRGRKAEPGENPEIDLAG